MTTTLASMRGQGGQADRPAKSIFDLLSDERTKKGIQAVAGQFLTPDRFLRLAINAIHKTPRLAECNPRSVLGAFMASAALGLEPNTVQQQAFLIPYAKRGKLPSGQWGVVGYDCQFQIGYRGFVTLAHRSPYISMIQAEAIHEGDFFDHMQGSEAFLKYRKALKDRGDLIGAFCHTKLESGIEMATVLPLDELHKIRSKSETYNALVRNVEYAKNEKDRQKEEKKLAETPWVMWEDDMAAKSAIKKQAKQLPLMPGDAFSSAAEIDNASDGLTIDMAAMADPDVARSVVEDGYEPPAIEHEPGETLEQTANFQQREPVTTANTKPTHHQQTNQADFGGLE